MKKQPSIVQFIDRVVKHNESGKPFTLLSHERDYFQLAYDLMSLCNAFIYSAIKKSGKTTLNAIFQLWWGFTHPDDEIKLAANDQEQSISRVFKVMCGIIRHNPALSCEAEILADKIRLKNGTVIEAIANDAPSEAGANQGSTGWDELWGYTSERSLRLWEELTPVPNKPSVRFVTTYAGWENESKLLWDLYLASVGTDEHPQGQAERIHADLPIYLNSESGILCYWDHEPRMPWQTPGYYASQKKNLRPGTYLRLHENRWTTAENIFITGELWDPCVDASLHPTIHRANLFVGVDAGIKHDTASVVSVKWDGERLALATHRIWKPTREKPLDIEATIEGHLRELHAKHNVRAILCDPYQLHRTITTLKGAGLRIQEFPQSTGNTTLMGQTLFDLLNGKNMRLYPAPDMREQALSTVAVENPRGWRIAKEKARRKIDAIVALSMACVAAVEGKPKIVNLSAVPTGVGRGFGYEIRKAIGSSFDQPSPFRDIDDEPPAKVHEVFRFRWGFGSDE
jgi:phage terminase large subunit-like protein